MVNFKTPSFQEKLGIDVQFPRRFERSPTRNLFVVLTIYILIFLFLNHYLESGQKYPKLYDSFKGALADTLFLYPTVDTDAYIVSTYYYQKSRSLGENGLAMVLLMNRNTMRDITNYQLTLVASNGTSCVTVVPELVKEVYASCAYVNVVAKTNVLPGMNKLEIVENGKSFEIPFQKPRVIAPKPVVICIAPQFVAEQWQLFITHAHVAHRFGGHLHLYVTSMIDSYFDLVKEYEREGYVTVDHWIRPKFSITSGIFLEPNANSEWRNQAGAQTDCLLQYKESATFITFFDLDDVLFPHGFDTYYDEFAFLSFLHPTVKTFHYDKRQFVVENNAKLTDMRFPEMFNNSHYESEFRTGKVMARPSSLDSMWIHHSFNTKDRERMFLRHNFITHIQTQKSPNKTNEFGLEEEIVELKGFQQNESVLISIQQDFEKMMLLPSIQSISQRLPKGLFYFPIIRKCYIDKYYGREPVEREKLCPNNEHCELPQREGVKCAHSDAEYVSGPESSPITFHWHVKPRWSWDYGCYQ